MTNQEHALIVGVLASQVEALNTLADILRSRGVLESDDLEAFWAVRTLKARKDSVEKAQQIYSLLATNLGMDLEPLPES